MSRAPNKQDLSDVKRHVRQHLMIAVGLALGTIMTVWTAETNFGSFPLNVAMTLGIAAIQAFMVAAFFMHLLSEKKMVYCFLGFTAFFFVLMMVVTFWARMPENIVHYK